MIELNYRDARPIYEQIMEGIRKLIVTGSMVRGDRLPSVRELAAMLTINPNTIARAYRELETEGYIYTVSGKGTFVAEVSGLANKRAEKLWEAFDEVTRELLYLSVPPEDLKERVTRIKDGRIKR